MQMRLKWVEQDIDALPVAETELEWCVLEAS